MEEERIDELANEQSGNAAGPDTLRTPVTILFSDIKGSTAYFERHGDVKGMAMVERHHNLLFPCIENNRGRIVKTIGDAIMALFNDPVDAVAAAADMQKVLNSDNRERESDEEIHIRIGVHTGLGLLRENDVFGDVVNAAARVQSQSRPDQILITDSLLSAAATAGFQVGKLGRAEMKGKDEPIDVYAVGWSPVATQQLIDDLQARSDAQLQEVKQARVQVEEEFDAARDAWREERRRLNAAMEKLEEGAAEAMEAARAQVAEEVHRQMQYKADTADKARGIAEGELVKAQERFESERIGYRARIANLESRVVEAMEQVNNPARVANQIREQVDKRLGEAKLEWQAQWDAERRRLQEQIERAKRAASRDPRTEARRAMMERLQAKRGGQTEGGVGLQAEKEKVEQERDQLQLRVASLEREVRRERDNARQEAYEELKRRYDQNIEQANRTRVQLEQEVRTLGDQLADERESAAMRIRSLEESVAQAEEAARAQSTAEVRNELESKLEGVERLHSRLERRRREENEEWDMERSRLEKQIRNLESNLQQAREMAFKRSSDPTVEELNRLRRQLEEEFRMKAASWEEERKHFLERIRLVENSPKINAD